MKNFLTFGLLVALANTTTSAMLAPLEAPCTNGKTPLMMAILHGAYINEDFIEKHKATINVQDTSGRTALHHAAAFDQSILIRLLIEKKADRSIRDNEGKTAEDIAIEREKIRAHNGSYSYEHCAEQPLHSPTNHTRSQPDITTKYTPRSPIKLGDNRSEEALSPNSSQPQNCYDLRYPDYASLL